MGFDILGLLGGPVHGLIQGQSAEHAFTDPANIFSDDDSARKREERIQQAGGDINSQRYGERGADGYIIIPETTA